MKNDKRGLSHMLASLGYSLQGLWAAVKGESAFRQELVFGVPHLLLSWLLPLAFPVRLYMTALFFALLVVELLNSAIEAVVDLASPEYHVLAKRAKDMASAAIFLTIVLIAVSWFAIVVNIVAFKADLSH